MNRSKKLFLIVTLIFLVLLALLVWDFSRRTEFREFGPQQEKQQIEP